MIRISTATIVAAVLMSAGLVTHAASPQKPAKTSTNWPCEVTMRDDAKDAIQSDKGGAYVNGIGGVTCVVVPPDSGSLTEGDLSLYFTKRPIRALFYPEQLGGEYPGYDASLSTGSLRVKRIATVGTTPEARAFIAYGPAGKFLASVEGDNDSVRDLVSVVATDACTWQVTMDDTGAFPNGHANMELWDGNEWSNLRGILQVPLALTVHVTGLKPGC